MAFGISRKKLTDWKSAIDQGDVAFLTHFWIDERFPGITTVTKVGCSDERQLIEWGKMHGLKHEWIHFRPDGYSHFDLLGKKQVEVLTTEGLIEQLQDLLNK
ncbi:hypothetical protein [Bacillus sp. FSL K6-3431]|uniref:hypothetical protein n=1 Tax=Bacillus sp. FSL K6-3431 TaxID=2921500 RepID=UPI0030F8075B